MQKINWILPTINGICKMQFEWIILQQNCTYHTRSTSPPCLAISALTLFANLTASSFSILVMGGRYHTSQTTENIKEIYDNLYHPNIRDPKYNYASRSRGSPCALNSGVVSWVTWLNSHKMATFLIWIKGTCINIVQF